MKAAVFHRCGDASQIKLETVPEPQLSAGQALIRVHASAFNHLELWAWHGPADESYRFPMWTGSDIAGVIEHLAPDVTDWSVGEAVAVNPSLSCGRCSRCLEGEVSQCDAYDILGSNGNGGNAEYVAVNADKLICIPNGFDFVKAAAAPLAYQTAWRALVRRAKLQKGEDVLILGASGGVAAAAVVEDQDFTHARRSGPVRALIVRDPARVPKRHGRDARGDPVRWRGTNARGRGS